MKGPTVGQHVEMLLGGKGLPTLHTNPEEEQADFPAGGSSSEPCQLQSLGHLRCMSAEIRSVLGVPQTKSEVAQSQFRSSSVRKWKYNAYL